MFRLTKQEQWIVLAIAGLLLVGWSAKVWRTTHPPEAPVTEERPNNHATD